MLRRLRQRLFTGASLLALLALLVAACGGGGGGSSSSGGGGGSNKQLGVAFFGFAAANSFAQATWAGVQKAAKEMNASAQFFDGDFSGTTQVKQMKDALVSGKYDVWVVQANSGSAVVPQVQEAISKGISVVIEFTPVGTRYDTAKPQVDGAISIVDVPTHNGKVLGELGIKACGDRSPCRVAYLQGDPSLPLDNARTKAVLKELSAVKVVAKPVGGYTQDQGRKVGQDLLVAHPDVDVIIGSAQAIEGVQIVVGQEGKLGKIQLIGNGGSIQAVKGVKSGKWFATYYTPEKTEGYLAAKYGIKHERGKKVPVTTDVAERFHVRGTKKAIERFDLHGQYRD
ncbi:MAG: sugar ABC transporter substrate-binding protein [Streptosporangiaceae bacterium]